MIPSVVATQVRNCVSDYLHTTFRPTTPGFDGLIDRFLAEPDHVCRGPYVSIGLPFRPGAGSTPFREVPLNLYPSLTSGTRLRTALPLTTNPPSLPQAQAPAKLNASYCHSWNTAASSRGS